MDFPLVLDLDDATPLHRQLSDALADCIVSGRIVAGEFLPGTKELARRLGISRATVVRSYAELASRRYVETKSGVGTFVRPDLGVRAGRQEAGEMRAPFALSSYADWLMKHEPIPLTAGDWPELNFGAGPPELLPVKLWRQSLLRHCRRHGPDRVYYTGEPLGYRPLREALASFLRRSRAVLCSADQVAIFPGSLQALNFVARLVVDRGDVVATENPGFPYARQVFESNRATVLPISVDQDGLLVEDLRRQASGAKLVYVTPSHQDPSGAVLSMSRRRELIDWARRNKAAILEDDYDSLHRYGGPPLPSLQGMDNSDTVIYISSFWKLLFPLSTAGFMVIPKSLISVFSRAEVLLESNFPLLEQYALTDFINEGHLERHIQRTRTIYAKRLQTMLHALTKHFRQSISFPRESAGTHLLVAFDLSLSDRELKERAAEAGLPMVSTRTYYAGEGKKGEFLIPFAHLNEDTIAAAVQELSTFAQKRLT